MPSSPTVRRMLWRSSGIHTQCRLHVSLFTARGPLTTKIPKSAHQTPTLGPIRAHHGGRAQRSGLRNLARSSQVVAACGGLGPHNTEKRPKRSHGGTQADSPCTRALERRPADKTHTILTQSASDKLSDKSRPRQCASRRARALTHRALHTSIAFLYLQPPPLSRTPPPLSVCPAAAPSSQAPNPDNGTAPASLGLARRPSTLAPCASCEA